MSPFHNLTESLKHGEGGFSARKLFGLLALIVGAHTTFKYGDDRTVVALAMVWLSFTLVCLGLVTVEQLARLKNGNSNSIESEGINALSQAPQPPVQSLPQQ